jgi:pimeloyl-ACP methyl ester carboxylesterase
MLYEHHREPLAPREIFLQRLARSFALGVALIAVSLGIGVVGYRYLLDLPWTDAYENAAMILSGMGPLDRGATFWAKVFGGTYALFSGFAVLAIAGVIFAPVVHRFLHYLHADPGDRKRGQ